MRDTFGNDDFFVGYLLTSKPLGRFIRRVVIVILVVLGAGAALLSFGQRDPGSGQWDIDHTQAVTGVLLTSPYPMLRTRGSDSSTKSILLIDQGKRGVATRVAGLNGATVTVRGTRIQRGPMTLIELADVPDPIQATTASSNANHESFGVATTVTLRGEIIDPKCHSGAMKPGDGKTHKACAALCIRGGIPPVFIDAGAGDASPRYLLVDESGNALHDEALEAILPFVGDSIEIRGTVRHSGDITTLSVTTPESVRRL
jgi:hypothetical protein